MVRDVEIQFDAAKLDKVVILAQSFPRKIPAVMRTAVNRTARTTRKDIVKVLEREVVSLRVNRRDGE